MKTSRVLLALSIAVAAASPISAQTAKGTKGPFSWPQWDGPERSGISAETEWSSEGKEEHLWTAELGLGYSTVVVQDGRLVTMGYDKESGLDTIFCFDAMSGEKLWSHSYPSKIWDRAHEGGTVNTPSFDGDRVYSLNREGNLFCLKAADGEVVWHTMLKPEGDPHGLEYPVWGFSASPLVLEESLILNCGRILSVDKEDGEVLWASEDYGHGYGTPVQFELEGEPVLAALNGNGLGVLTEENGIDLFFHEFGGKNRGINAATPVLVGEDLFISPRPNPAAPASPWSETRSTWSGRTGR